MQRTPEAKPHNPTGNAQESTMWKDLLMTTLAVIVGVKVAARLPF